MTKKELCQKLKNDSELWFRHNISEDMTVWGLIIKHSSMVRHCQFYIIKNNTPIWITGHLCNYLQIKRSKNDAMIIRGCGFSAIDHVVSNLSLALFGKSDKLSSGKL